MSHNRVALVLYEGCDVAQLLIASDVLSGLADAQLFVVAQSRDCAVSDSSALTVLSSHAFDEVTPDVVFVPEPTSTHQHMLSAADHFLRAHPNAEKVHGDGFSRTIERCLDVVERRSGVRRARQTALVLEYDPLPDLARTQ